MKQHVNTFVPHLAIMSSKVIKVVVWDLKCKCSVYVSVNQTCVDVLQPEPNVQVGVTQVPTIDPSDK